MNITPKAGPTVLTPPTATANASAAREKAINTFMGNSQNAPVQNPTSVSPEEMGALRQPNTSKSADLKLTSNPETDSPKPAEVAAPEEPISSQYALLAKREKAMRMKAQQQEQAFKAREAALLAKEEALKAQPAQDPSQFIPKDKLQQDTVRTLIEAGLSYDQITEAFMSGPSNPHEIARDTQLRKLAEDFKAVREELANTQKSYQQQQVDQEQEVIRRMDFEAKNLIDTDPEFETIKAYGAASQVTKLIQRTFDEDGLLLSVEEAARLVEENLVERAIKLSRLNKIQQRLKAAEPKAAAPAATTDSSKQQAGMRTLTNSMGATKPMSVRERAIAAMEGRLSK